MLSQHDGLLEMCEVDIRTISFLVDVVKWLFPKFEYTVRDTAYGFLSFSLCTPVFDDSG